MKKVANRFIESKGEEVLEWVADDTVVSVDHGYGSYFYLVNIADEFKDWDADSRAYAERRFIEAGDKVPDGCVKIGLMSIVKLGSGKAMIRVAYL